jgi:tetratricopeptide (TPR) repeat protein
MTLTSNDFVAIRLQADLFYATKRPQAAFDLLTKFVDRTDVQPQDRSERIRLAAEELAELGRQLTKADQQFVADQFARQALLFYRSYSAERPGQKLPLAVFLSGLGQDKWDESLDLLDQALNEEIAPDAFARACAAVLDNIAANKEKMKRLEQIIGKAIDKFHRPFTLLMVMADAYSRQGRYADAETYYRQVIEQNSKDAVARNNLAMLLALQGIKLDEAVSFADQAVDIMGPLGPVLDTRACVYLAMHEPDKALRDIEEALNDKETPVRLFHQAEIFSQRGEENSVRTSMFKALQTGLTKDMLQPLEAPAFEKLKQQAK